MSRLGQLINISLTLENSRFIQSINHSEQNARKFAQNFGYSMRQADQYARKFADNARASFKRLEQETKKLTDTPLNFHSIFNTNDLLSSVTKSAKAYTDIHNKMKLVSNSSMEAGQRLADVFDIAMKTSQSTEVVSSVYQTFAQNAHSVARLEVEECIPFSGVDYAATQLTWQGHE